jgi:hypothetical protein
LAEAGSIELVLPAFSLSEPYDSFGRRSNDRKAMLTSLEKETKALARSEPYADIGAQSTATATRFSASVNEEERRREGLIGSAEDAVVFASVAAHLSEKKPEKSCFLEKDRDFDDPEVRRALENHHCRLIHSFDGGLAHIRGQVKK